MVKNKKCACFF